MAALLIIILSILIGVALFGTWLYALVDAIGGQFENPTDKVIWIILILFLPFLGTILYMMIGRKKRIGGHERLSQPVYQEEELV